MKNNEYINPYDLSEIHKKAERSSKSHVLDFFSFDPSKSSLISPTVTENKPGDKKNKLSKSNNRSK